MLEYKAVYVRPDGSCYKFTFPFRGTRYQLAEYAEKIKVHPDDKIVYIRSKSGDFIITP